MNINLVLVIDFSNKNNPHSQYSNLEQKILTFSSMIIKLLLKRNLNQKIAIIINRGEIVEQLCHLSNNIFHHIQGLKRILKTGIYGKKNIKSCIILATRLINFTNQICNSEILLISSKYDSDISIHYMGANLIKNQIKFSAIEFEEKSFIYETVSKLTGGFYINYKLCGRKETFICFKDKISKNITKFSKNYLSLGIERIKCFNMQIKKKGDFKLKILNYCPVCGLITIGSKLCVNCGIVFLNNFFYTIYDFKNLDLNIFEKRSIFNYDLDTNIIVLLNNIYKI